MIIDGKVFWTFLETVLFFGILGGAVDVWLQSKKVYLYPAYGIVAFGLLMVPMTYVLSQFHLVVMWVVSLMIVSFGVVGIFRFGRRALIRIRWRPEAAIVALLAIGLVVLALVQASQYAIPGGIDSAIHSTIIQGVVATSTTLPGTYPLGMHITVFGLEKFFHAQQELVFLSFYLVLSLSAIASLAYAAGRMSKNFLVGYLALAAGCIDVSLYNNYINGSGTHLVGIAFSAFLLLAAILLEKKPTWFQIVGMAAVLSVIWYYHYPTLFFSLPLLWAWRLGTRQANTWVFLEAFSLALIMSIPLQLKLIHDPSYVKLIVPGVGVALIVELLMASSGRLFQRVIWHRATLLILAVGSAWLFFHYDSSFLFLPTWYGVLIIRLALVGLLAAVVNRRAFSVTALLSFAMLSILQAELHQSPLASQSTSIIELFYYFGFTCSLILLGTAGMAEVILLIHSRRGRQILIGFVTVYAILLVASRSFDRKFIDSLLAGDRPISRYESSGGFGIFYTKNDAALANWVKNNIPAAGIIANPGGLYNTWASLTGHPTLWASYNVPTIAEPAPYLASVKHLLRDEPAADVDLLRRRGIEYILVPEQFSVAMYHPRVQLLKQIGRARLYRLSDSSLAVRLPIPLGNDKSNDGISVTTNGHSSCRYCGNAFYFTDQDNLTQLELAPTGTIAITLPADILRRGYPETLLVDHSDGTVDYRTNDSEWKTSAREAIALPQNKSEIIRVIQLRNASKTSRIFFFSMAVQLTK